MHDFILLMHDDVVILPTSGMWPPYFAELQRRDAYDGGSSIGAGKTFRKQGIPGEASDRLAGYVRIRAKNLAAAADLLAGNPVFECGGTVEIRELPKD